MEPTWVLEGRLARSPRPGYRPGAEAAVPRDVVDEWLAGLRRLGIASILCLLADDQLPLYEPALPGGLLRYYRRAGFHVAHLPAPDAQAQPYTAEQLEAAWRAYQELPKPVLVHCSAGYDRTGRVVDHILARLNGGAPLLE